MTQDLIPLPPLVVDLPRMTRTNGTNEATICRGSFGRPCCQDGPEDGRPEGVSGETGITGILKHFMWVCIEIGRPDSHGCSGVDTYYLLCVCLVFPVVLRGSRPHCNTDWWLSGVNVGTYE